MPGASSPSITLNPHQVEVLAWPSVPTTTLGRSPREDRFAEKRTIDSASESFYSPPHVQKDEAEFCLCPCQDNKQRRRTNRHHNHVAVLSLDIDLIKITSSSKRYAVES